MPAAPDDQVPKPLTYTLMYHGLWAALFLLSYLTLAAIFLAPYGPRRALVAPWSLLALALVAAAGFLVTYGIRLSVLVGEFDKEDAFAWSAGCSWVVVALAPVLFALWLLLEPRVQQAVNGGLPWAPPEAITSAMFKVEVVVWWLSHLLSIRGLARGRRKYLTQPPNGTPPAPPTPATSPPPPDPPAPVLTPAAEGRR